MLVGLDPQAGGWYAQQAMTPDAQRAYVRRWAEAGRLLDDQRWRELATLTSERALAAADALLEAALRVPLSESRRSWSGLVDLQKVLHRKRP